MEEEWISVKKEVGVGRNLKEERELWSGYDILGKKILKKSRDAKLYSGWCFVVAQIFELEQ